MKIYCKCVQGFPVYVLWHAEYEHTCFVLVHCKGYTFSQDSHTSSWCRLSAFLCAHIQSSISPPGTCSSWGGNSSAHILGDEMKPKCLNHTAYVAAFFFNPLCPFVFCSQLIYYIMLYTNKMHWIWQRKCVSLAFTDRNKGASLRLSLTIDHH